MKPALITAQQNLSATLNANAARIRSHYALRVSSAGGNAGFDAASSRYIS